MPTGTSIFISDEIEHKQSEFALQEAQIMVDKFEEKIMSEEIANPPREELLQPNEELKGPLNADSKELEDLMRPFIKALEPQKDKHIRNDIFKTKIFRVLQKIPLHCVQSLKLVKIADYKSSQKPTFKNVFYTVFEYLDNILASKGLYSTQSTREERLVDLISLHFPISKVRRISRDLNNLKRANSIIKLRSKTSLTNYKEMAQSNVMVLPLLRLIMQYSARIDQIPKTKEMIATLNEEINQ